MDESDLKDLSDSELHALTALVKGLIEDPKVLIDYSREEFNNGLRKANWIQAQIRAIQKAFKDDDFAFYYELFADFGYRVLAQKYDISGKDDSAEYWRSLCIRVIDEFVPAYKIRGWKPKKADNKKLDLIGRVEWICLTEDVAVHTAARILSQRTSSLKQSSIKTDHTNYVGEFALKLINSNSSEDTSAASITLDEAKELVKKLALNHVIKNGKHKDLAS